MHNKSIPAEKTLNSNSRQKEPPIARRNFSAMLRQLSAKKEAGAMAALIVIVIILSIVTNTFFTSNNLLNIARQISTLSIMAVGMTFVIITGGVDLSVGSIQACAACILALTLQVTGNVVMGIIVALVTGLIVGCLNGTLVALVKLPPFVVTLATTTAFRGVALLITGGWPITLPSNTTARWFFFIGNGKVLGNIPMQAIIMVGIVTVGAFLLHKTVFGQQIFAVGGNERAAELAGIHTKLVKLSAYALTGLLCGVAAVLTVAYARTAQPTLGDGTEQNVIAAAVIGGAVMSGGEGSVLGSILGAITIGVMLNGLTLLGASADIQKVMIGIIIITAVILSERFRTTAKK